MTQPSGAMPRTEDQGALLDAFEPVSEAEKLPVPTIPWLGRASNGLVTSNSVPTRFRTSTFVPPGVSVVDRELRSTTRPVFR